MKLSIPLLVLLLIIPFSSCKKEQNLLNETEIKESVNRAFLGLVEATRSLDFDRYRSYFDEEKFSGLSADGTIIRSFSEFEELYKPGFEMIEEFESLVFDSIHITVIDEHTVILVNEYHDQVRLKSGEVMDGKGGGTQVWSDLTGSWKLVSVSSSSN